MLEYSSNSYIILSMASSETSSPELFEPSYWDGHFLGDGDDLPEPLGQIENYSPTRRLRKIARPLLKDSLPPGTGYYHEQSFAAGEELDIADVDPDTFILFDIERLGYQISKNHKEVGDLTSKDTLNWVSEPFASRISLDKIYQRSLKWGVVVDDTRSAKRRLLAGNASDLLHFRTAAPFLLANIRPQFSVGAVRHYTTRKRHEALERVNRVELHTRS